MLFCPSSREILPCNYHIFIFGIGIKDTSPAFSNLMTHCKTKYETKLALALTIIAIPLSCLSYPLCNRTLKLILSTHLVNFSNSLLHAKIKVKLKMIWSPPTREQKLSIRHFSRNKYFLMLNSTVTLTTLHTLVSLHQIKVPLYVSLNLSTCSMLYSPTPLTHHPMPYSLAPLTHRLCYTR